MKDCVSGDNVHLTERVYEKLAERIWEQAVAWKAGKIGKGHVGGCGMGVRRGGEERKYF